MSDEIEKIAENMNPMFNAEQEFHVITKNNKEDNFNLYTILSTGDNVNIEKLNEIKEIIKVSDRKVGTFKKIYNYLVILFGNINIICSIFSFIFLMFYLYLFKENDNDNDEVEEGFIIEDKQKFIKDNKDILLYINLGFAGFHLLSLLYYLRNIHKERKDNRSLEDENEKIKEYSRMKGRREAAGSDLPLQAGGFWGIGDWMSDKKEKTGALMRDQKDTLNASYYNMRATVNDEDFKGSLIRVFKILIHLVLFIGQIYFIMNNYEILK